jgi:tripartite-type tricarboxylate transporter receptor subunit TctC
LWWRTRAGAGGNIASTACRAVAYGYTHRARQRRALVVNPHILKTAYDPLKDLVPIFMAAFREVLVVQPRSG